MDDADPPRVDTVRAVFTVINATSTMLPEWVATVIASLAVLTLVCFCCCKSAVELSEHVDAT